MQGLFKSSDGLLSMLCFALSKSKIVNDLRSVRETAAGFGEKFHRAPGIFYGAEEQLRQSHVRAGPSGIYQQALLVICCRFCELGFCLLDLVCPLK